MILVEWGIHLTARVNGSHGHWSTVAKAAKNQRTEIAAMVESKVRRLTNGEPFERKKVTYSGRFRGVKVEKTKMVKVLSPEWAKRLDSGMTVVLTRFAAKPLDDDNLRAAFKSIRDGVADVFAIRDDDPRVTFVYGQVLEPPSRIVVRVAWADEPVA